MVTKNTGCLGGDCPTRDTCLRYRTYRKALAAETLSNIPYENGKCEFYWPQQDQQLVTKIERLKRRAKKIICV